MEDTAKQNMPVTKGQVLWVHLYEVPTIAKFVEARSRVVVPRGWEEDEQGIGVEWEQSFVLER
jgi:hypothetical protein